MLEADKLRELREKAKLLTPVVRIGKNGLTPNQIIEVQKVLKTKRLVKIKFLRNFLEGNDIDEAVAKIVAECKCELVMKTGFVAVVYR